MKARARHILVTSEENCQEIIQSIVDGADFAALAQEHSQCPSGRNGGDLGEFGQGMMVPEFDQVIFDEANETGKVYPSPVKTQFGFHVIEILERA